MDSKTIGTLYEIYICDYLNTLPTTKCAYLWKNVPDNILENIGLLTKDNAIIFRKNRNNTLNPFIDIGIDIVCVNNDNKIDLIQCKNYKTSITISDLAGFYFVMAHFPNHNGYVYHPNNIISHNITNFKKVSNIMYIHKPYKCVQQSSDIILRDYQKQAIKIYSDYFNGNNNYTAVLSFPPGTGKTLISAKISLQYKIIIFITPLKQYAQQTVERFKEYKNDISCILLTHETRKQYTDINTYINSLLNNEKNIVICSTFKSSPIILKFINDYKNNTDMFMIIDEFHNLSYNQIYNAGALYELLRKDIKKLFVSATPKIYYDSANNLTDGKEDCSVFGNTLYNLSFTDAIEQKYITDYTIYTPEYDNEILQTHISEIESEISFVFDDRNVAYKCQYLFECIKNFGLLKTIIYFTSQNEANIFQKYFVEMNKYYNYTFTIGTIISATNKKDREYILNEFAKNPLSSFICNVEILDECIDIKECNSVYFTYESKSKIKNIQRIARCLRIDKKFPNKKGKILLWKHNNETLLNSIREYDTAITTKIDIIKYKNNTIIKPNKDIHKIKNNKISNTLTTKHNTTLIMKDIKVPQNAIMFDGTDDKPEHIILQSQKLDNNNIINHDAEHDLIYKLKEHLKCSTTYDEKFINKYLLFYKACEIKKYGIKLDDVLDFLQIRDAHGFYKRFNKKYKENIDYIKERKLKKIIKGDKIVEYYITLDIFEKICITTHTEKGNSVRDYFIILRKFVNSQKATEYFS